MRRIRITLVGAFVLLGALAPSVAQAVNAYDPIASTHARVAVAEPLALAAATLGLALALKFRRPK
jgi:hypothetical protein